MPEYFYFVLSAFSVTFVLLGVLGLTSWWGYASQLKALRQKFAEEEFYESR